jgi:hypothetical protein
MKTIVIKCSLLLVAMLLVCTVPSRATDFTYNGLKYTTLSDSTCQTKAGYSHYESGFVVGNSVMGDLVIPDTVYYNSNAYSVTGIGEYAFSNCIGLTKVAIPNSVNYIGDSAFSGCTGIIELNIADSETMLSIGTNAFIGVSPKTAYLGRDISSSIFGGNTELSSITIGDKVTSIVAYAFRDCTSLKLVTIPNSVTSIGESAFQNCSDCA